MTFEVAPILDKLLSVAKSHPLYKDQAASARSFFELPVLTKSEFNSRLHTVLSSKPVREPLYWSPSSGTSDADQLTLIPVGVQENERQRDLLALELGKFKVFEPGEVVANFFGAQELCRASEIVSGYIMRCGATTLPLSDTARDVRVAEICARLGATTLAGSPKRLIKFAGYCREKSLQSSFQKIVFGGEHLTIGAEEVIRNRFDCRRIFGLFGSAETGVWGFSGNDGPISKYIIPKNIMHLELIDIDINGNGKLIVTNLLREKFPVLRFCMGDRGALSEDGDYFQFRFSARDRDEIIVDGQRLDLSSVETAFAWAQAIQIVIAAGDQVVVNIVDQGGKPIDFEKCQTLFRSITGWDVAAAEKLEIRAVEFSGIVRSENGLKAPLVIDQRKKPE